MRPLHRILRQYIRDNLGINIFAVSFFLAGIVLGALLIRFLEIEHLQKLQGSMNVFLEDLKFYSLGNLEPSQLLKASCRKNIFFLILIWFLGLFRLGYPLVFTTILFRGLALGFTAGFLVYRFTLKGLLFSLAALLPHNIFLVPAFLWAAALAIAYSYLSANERVSSRKVLIGAHFNEYCSYMLLSFLLILAGGLVEAYLSPIFMRLVASFFF